MNEGDELPPLPVPDKLIFADAEPEDREMDEITLPLTLRVEQTDSGLIYVTSPSHPDLLVAAESLADALRAVPEVLAAQSSET